jgi:hypothetical protein
MSQVILLSLTASLNLTLVAATTVMLLLDKPSRLMLGYLLGAYMTSITLGLVIVFSLSNSSASNTTENTISLAVDIGLGAIALAVAFVLYTGRHERQMERRRTQGSQAGQGPAALATGAEQRVGENHVRHRRAALAARRLIPGRSPRHPQAQVLDHYDRAAGDRLQPGDDVAARDPPGVIPGRSPLDAARDRAGQTLDEPACPHVCHQGIHRRGGTADHQGSDRAGRLRDARQSNPYRQDQPHHRNLRCIDLVNDRRAPAF